MRFKKGDRVRWLRVPGRFQDATVTATDEPAPWQYKIQQDNGEYTYASDDELELVPAATAASTTAGTFKVGDRVRYVNGKYGEATVIAITPLGIQVDTGGQYGICTERPSSLELVDWDFDPRKPLKIEAGKFYKTRDGRKVGPMRANANEYWPHKTHNDYWKADGTAYWGNSIKSDLISEWFDSCAAAQVDNLRDEYGPFAGAEACKRQRGQAKFKVGDRVITQGGYTFSGSSGEVVAVCVDGDPDLYKVGNIEHPHAVGASWSHRTNMMRLVSDAVATSTPAIVALIKDGQPKPADRPHVHADRAAAEKEANRLARKYPGKEFGVYELVSTIQQKPVYDHEWQRLAAEGRKIEAIKEIRSLTGLGLKATKDAVEDWLTRLAA